ncbi:SH3 domain-containing protein [Lagierella sp.]|uniref:SH3 domain-containing protein n=1 Tax=Lagierella sp. TaxID=2849657 RepID=UPI002605ECDA|nr:SH3 domain-containing protein [Lagierella sp.]
MKKKIGLVIITVCVFLTFTSCYKKETYTSVRDKNKKQTDNLATMESQAKDRIDTDATDEEKRAKVDVESLNVRENPGANENLVTSLTRGTTVDILEEIEFDGQKWSKIQSGEYEGYVLSEYLAEN